MCQNICKRYYWLLIIMNITYKHSSLVLKQQGIRRKKTFEQENQKEDEEQTRWWNFWSSAEGMYTAVVRREDIAGTIPLKPISKQPEHTSNLPQMFLHTIKVRWTGQILFYSTKELTSKCIAEKFVQRLQTGLTRSDWKKEKNKTTQTQTLSDKLK